MADQGNETVVPSIEHEHEESEEEKPRRQQQAQ
jgi:hypothetical protein